MRTYHEWTEGDDTSLALMADSELRGPAWFEAYRKLANDGRHTNKAIYTRLVNARVTGKSPSRVRSLYRVVYPKGGSSDDSGSFGSSGSSGSSGQAACGRGRYRRVAGGGYLRRGVRDQGEGGDMTKGCEHGNS